MRASFNLGKTSGFYSIGSAAILMLSSYGEYAVFISITLSSSSAHLLHCSITTSNARFVANQLERIYMQHATRCVQQKPDDKQEWRQLTADDIVPIEIPHKKVKMGF